MATNFYKFNGINLGPLSSDPSPAEAGDAYYNTSTNAIRYYNGSVWGDVPTGTFANQSLSNLTNPTAINQDLIFNKTAPVFKTEDQTGATVSQDLVVRAGNTDNALSGQLVLRSGDVNTAGTGTSGAITLRSGNHPSGNANTTGTLTMRTGNNSGSGSSGPTNVLTGTTVNANSGQLTLSSGSTSSGISGNAGLSSGSSGTGQSGNVNVGTGQTSTSGTTGALNLFTGNAAGGSNSGSIILTTGSSSGVRGQILLNGSQINANSTNIVSVADPVSPQDAATKNYVDTMSGGANTTLSNLTSPTAINQDLLPGITNNNEIGSSSFQWGTVHVGSLYRNGNERFNLTLGQLKDSSSVVAINLDNRNLQDTSGAVRVNWSGSETIFTGSVRPVVTNTASNGTPTFQWLTVNAANFVSNDAAVPANLLAIQQAGTGSTFPNTAAAFLYSVYGTGPTARILSLVTQNDSAANADATNPIEIITGNKTAGTGNSAAITIKTGTSSGGTRGQVVLDGSEINASSKNIINVTDPVNAQDAATKSYTDNNISGTRGSPNSIVAGTGITPLDRRRQVIFVEGNGGAVTITAVPAVVKTSAIIGDEIKIIGRSATNTVTIDNQSGDVELNGAIILGLSDVLTLVYDGTAYVEVSRSN